MSAKPKFAERADRLLEHSAGVDTLPEVDEHQKQQSSALWPSAFRCTPGSCPLWQSSSSHRACGGQVCF